MVLKYKGRKKLVKTIEDALSILDDNSPIAVGSRSAFYFIGSVSDYRRDIPLIEDHYRRKYERGLTQIKNSLESVGESFRFEIRPHTGFRWIAASGHPMPSRVKEDLNWTDQIKDFKTKQEEAAFILTKMLKERDVASKEIFLLLSERGIAEKTARHVKEEMGIKAYRKNRRWFWTLNQDVKEDSDFVLYIPGEANASKIGDRSHE